MLLKSCPKIPNLNRITISMKTIKGSWLHVLQLTALVLMTATASAQLNADFSGTPITGCPPMVVTFKDASTGAVSWEWNLGNGTTSTKQNPIATYFDAGTYDVTLIITDANGKKVTKTKKDFIIVNALPTPRFDVNSTGGCFPLKVQFTDKSLPGSGNIVKWQWDFGDGEVSKLNEQNPEHTYTNGGNYTVILRVENSNGCANDTTATGLIKVQNGVNADFTFASGKGCVVPAAVNFTNKSAGTGTLSYKWDFGNGKSSFDENPVNEYDNAGVYTATLIATNSFGCADTLIKTNAINIGQVKSGFTAPDNVCVGSTAQFTNTSVPSTFVGSKWYFGDDTTSTKANSSHIFKVPGVYQVKLVTDFGSCPDSITKPINVLPAPEPTFTATNNTGCNAPLTVDFKNTSSDGISYEWNFGDGTAKSFLENPQHIYQKDSTYTVSLTVKNAAGCIGVLVKPGFVKIVPPSIVGLTGLPIKECIPATVRPTAILKDTVGATTYLWDFGDGTPPSTDAAPAHIYTVAGSYDVKLEITSGTGCIDTLTIRNAVKVGSKPQTEFKGEPLDACAFTPVNFTDLSIGTPVNDWFWDFGDGATSGDSLPIHKYIDTGFFTITLISYNFGCSDTLIKENYVHINPPIAKFDTAFFCADPLTRRFIDKSIDATSWEWEFGDGGTSKDQNPSYTYAKSGTYPVTLLVKNGQCQDVLTTDVLVLKTAGKLDINFADTCANQRVIFNVVNTVPSDIVSYNWFFDGLSGGNIITTNNPVAASFSTPGDRASAVVLTNILKCRDTLFTAVPIKVSGPKADFSSLDLIGCYGNPTNFTDLTVPDGTHPIVNWSWNFGDVPATKNYTTPTNFSHNYSEAGTYKIKLVVTDSKGCKDSVFKNNYITITKTVAQATASDTSVCPGTKITFTNKSTGEKVVYTWDFGDGTTITHDYSPVHEFKDPGVYVVKMLMVDKNNCRDSVLFTIKVFIAKAEFDLSDNFSSCPPLMVNITNKSANYVMHSWDFGDGGNSQLVDPSHFYTYPGQYTVKLIVVNNGGCSDTLVKRVRILGPTGNFDYTPKEVCLPGKVEYTLNAFNAVNFIWDFNDGTTIFSTNTKVFHTYTAAGNFLPKIILQDGNGCQVAIKGKDPIKVNSVETHIIGNNRLLCDSGFIAFTDSSASNDIITNCKWNFGDGGISTGRAATHKFTTTGYYNVTLITTTKFGCADTTVEEKYIKVVNSPDVRIMGDTSACEPGQLTFKGAFVRTDTSKVTWNWDLGNGQISRTQNPVLQTYPKAGSYPVVVKVTNSDGCTDEVSRKVIIHPKPVVDAGRDTTICKFTSYTLQVTGADKYTWKSNNSLSCTNCDKPVAKPDKLTTYYVTGKTVFGCTNQDSITIKVLHPFKMVVPKGDTLCIGESIDLQVTGADVYTWTPPLYLDNAKSGTVKSKPDTTITYVVTGKDTLGCFKETANIKLKVYPKPVTDITNGAAITVQLGSAIKLKTKNTADITKWRWTPEQGLSCGSCAEPLAAPKETTTFNVTAYNDGNCTATDDILVNVICNNANVYMPNTFSPNGDGMNDSFYPRGSGLYNIRTFKIFNRWGQVVFARDGISANNPAYGWDGRMNGKEMQPDVYVYLLEVVCVNNIVFPFKGNVTLVR
ncbi:MAG: hypothetical protein JWQ40_2609 [Segetibacter sp.]|nr:hypothetical protein [Segetibacter sp.]